MSWSDALTGDGQAQCLLCGRVIAVRYLGELRINPKYATTRLDAVRPRRRARARWERATGGPVLRTESPDRVDDRSRDATARTILVIEDSEPIRRILALLLEGHGYEVRAVEAGEEGLRLARLLHPCA